ncbi:MAG: glycosyltransferase [Actinobacteria bacterium]|nr:glycosyltransferase [Actinomycetota bacterium]
MGKKKRKPKEKKTVEPKRRPAAEEGLTSIIIPVHNRVELTRLCIEAVEECTPEGSYELIVVDNGSTDATPEYLAGTGAHVIRFPENRGIAVAWNAGIREAKGRYLVFLHNDVLVSPGWLEAILRPFGDRRVACACPSYTEFNFDQGFAKLAAGVSRMASRRWERRIAPFCFALSRNAIHRLGDFDEALAHGPYADVDFEFRLVEAGLRSVSANNALVHHFGGQTALKLPEFYGENDEQNWRYLNKKWGVLPARRLANNPEFEVKLEAMRNVVLPDKIPNYREQGGRGIIISRLVRLIAVTIFYNEREMLPGCLETLDDVDEIVLVDGAYADFPYEVPWSTDGTLEWIKERQKIDTRIRLIECKTAWADEVEKRSAYFTGGEGDWYLIIDADERLVCVDENTMESLKSYVQSYPLDYFMLDVMTQPATPQIERYGRIFRHLPGLRYETAHSNIVADGKMLLAESPSHGTVSLYSGCHIVHLKKARLSERVEEKYDYYQKLAAREIGALKKEVVACWNDRSKKREHEAFVKMYRAQLAMLGKAEAERIAIDPEYLSFENTEGRLEPTVD